jgi:hypothetical protein
MKNKNIILLITFIVCISCSKESQKNELSNNKKGFFIVNEGNFTWGNSSLSFYDEINSTIDNDIFFKANQVPLGDVAFDMKIINNKGFISINNSGIIYVINPENSKHIKTISGFISPRYILPINDSIAYVSDLYSPYITIIHTEKLQKHGTIFIGSSTESMVKVNNKVFVTSWSFKQKVYVINTITHNTIDSIIVGKQPQSIVVDKNDKIWILCDGGYQGNPIGHEAPSLWKINTLSHQVENVIIFPSLNYMARSLSINQNKDSLTFIYHHIYRISVNDTIFPNNYWLASNNKNYYTVWHHPKKPWLIISDAKNYVSRGSVLIYSTSKQLLNEIETGIIPSAFCYKE